MIPTLKLREKLMVLILVPLVFAVFVSVSLIFLLGRLHHEINCQMSSKRFEDTINEIHDLAEQPAAAYYLRSNRGIDVDWRSQIVSGFDVLANKIEKKVADLKKLPQLTQQQRRDAELVEELANQVIPHLKSAQNEVSQGNDLDSATSVITAGVFALKFSEKLDPIREQNATLRDQSDDRELQSIQLINLLICAAIPVDIILALLLRRYFNTDTTHRFARLLESAHSYAAGKPIGEPLQGTDEIAALHGVFHSMVKEINETTRLRKEFVATVTHELRSPVTSILGSMNILSDTVGDSLTEKAMELVRRNERSLDRVVRLINDLLDVEKLEAGRMQLEMDEVPTAFLLDQAMYASFDVAREKGIQIQMPDAESFLYGDGERLSQVLINIMGYVLKNAAEDSKVIITLTEGEGYVEIQVHDPSEKLVEESVFDRYQGGDISLAVCKEIIDQHKGNIGIRSNSGNGKIWWFRIPIKSSEANV